MVNLAQILCVVMFLACCVSGSPSRRKLFKSATYNMTEENISKLIALDCHVEGTGQRNVDGFAHWEEAYLQCPHSENLLHSQPIVLCDRKCYNAIMCKEMKKFTVTPVMRNIALKQRDEVEVPRVDVPVACICEPRTVKVCRKNKKKRRGQ